MTTKAALLSIAVLLAASACLDAQERKAVPSTITEATVFFNGAELTHTATTRLTRGENEITIEGLSPYIDVNSLKIKVSDNVVVASSEFSVDYMNSAREATPLLQELQAKIDAKKEELAKASVDIKINYDMIALLKEGITKNISGSEAGLGTDELKKTLDYYKAKSEELEGARVALTNSRTAIQTELHVLQNQYNQEAVKGGKTSGVLRLNLSAPREGNASFAITYYTSQAGWVPFYDINVADAGQPVAIVARSKVCQTTGLDWAKVKLTLSTSVPNNGKVAPLFSAWFLQPVVSNDTRLAKARGAAMQNTYSYDFLEYDEDEIVLSTVENSVPIMASTMQDYIVASENELNVTYAIDLPYSIPGNGKEQTIDLMRREAPAEYRYYTTPKLDMRTYLLAEIADWQKLGLLSGTANVTYAGTYVGQTYIDASSTTEKLTLTLGTDARVAVKREKMQDFSSSRTIGNDIQQTFTYRITVKNNQNKPVMLVTKDQYPISTIKGITVTFRTKETTPWTYNAEDIGVLTWEEELAPGEARTYDISYTVRYPELLKLNL